MDAELQKSVREFQPNDPMTHAVWQRLMRVHPLRDVLATVPYQELSLKGLFLVAHKTLGEVSKRILAQKGIKPGKANTLREFKHVSIEADGMNAGQFLASLARAMGQLEEFVKDDMACHMALDLSGSASDSDYFGNTIHNVDINLQTTMFRPETAEETKSRLDREVAQREAKKEARRESAKKKKLEQEERDLAQLARLQKKYGKKLKE